MKIIGKILQTALLLALIVALGCNVYMILATKEGEVPTAFGFSWAVVMSGSMEPAISVDDLVVARAQKDYEIGDVITYQRGSSLVTHRIVDKADGGFITQGDANNAPDIEPVEKESVVGKIVLTVKNAGQVIGYLRTPMGAMCIAMAAVLLLLLPRVFERTKDEQGRNS